MSQLWIPSDELLQRDPIAQQKIRTPFEPVDVEAQGIRLFDVEDEAANEAGAWIALASLDDGDLTGDESGDCDDDEQLDDPADAEPVTAEI